MDEPKPQISRQAEHMRRLRMERALADGREPGKPGRPSTQCRACGARKPRTLEGKCPDCGTKKPRASWYQRRKARLEAAEAKVQALKEEIASRPVKAPRTPVDESELPAGSPQRVYPDPLAETP